MPWSVLRYVPILGSGAIAGPLRRARDDGVVVLMAQALAHLGRRYPERRRRWLTAVGVLLAIELVPGPRTLYSAGIPALYQTIARTRGRTIRVLELPVGVRDGTSSMGAFRPRAQYFQTRHGKAIIGGYLSRVSPGSPARRTARARPERADRCSAKARASLRNRTGPRTAASTSSCADRAWATW